MHADMQREVHAETNQAVGKQCDSRWVSTNLMKKWLEEAFGRSTELMFEAELPLSS